MGGGGVLGQITGVKGFLAVFTGVKQNSFFLSGVKESRRRRENFQDLALDLKEKPLKIAFLMLKTSKFSPAALMITLPLPIPSLKIPFINHLHWN